jgi:hypothetical protein
VNVTVDAELDAQVISSVIAEGRKIVFLEELEHTIKRETREYVIPRETRAYAIRRENREYIIQGA